MILDKEIEYILIYDDENEIEERGYKPPPLAHPRERLKTFNKMLEKVDDRIGVFRQTPLHPIEKMKKSLKRNGR